MKIGVRTTTPPAGTPVAPKVTVIQVPPPTAAPSPLPTLTATPLPVLKTPLPVLKTPLPVLKTPLPIVPRSSAAHGRTPAPAVVAPSGGATARTLVIGGLCMIAFSCGVMCTIAVDRLWPRAHAQCVGAELAGTGAAPAEGSAAAPAQPSPDIEAVAERAAAATTMAVTPLPTAEPTLPAAEASAPKLVPAAAAMPAARPVRGAAVARIQPAQGRAGVRKRSAGTTSSLPVDTMSPTGLWVDPFAE